MEVELCIFVFAILAAYYGLAIIRVGLAPKCGPIATRYEPPDGMSPAEVRYAWKGAVDERSVACVLTQLAVKGRISIVRTNGRYDITRIEAPPDAPQNLAPEEQVTMDWLFANFLTQVKFDPQHDAQGLSMALRGSLDRRLRGKYEATHYGYVAVGLLLSLMAAYYLARGIGWNRVPPSVVYGLFMAALIASIVLSAVLIPAMRDYTRRMGSIGRIVFGLLVSVFAIGTTAAIAMRLRESAGLAFPLTVIALAAVNVFPVPWLHRVTQAGLQARAQTEGFREFLERVEQDQLDRANPSDAPLQPREVLLPFAIALEVREAWGDSLANACFPHLITE